MDPDTLRAALATAGSESEVRAFLLLRLAEEDDGSAYEELKILIGPTFGESRRELSRFQTPLLEDAVRRRDLAFLNEIQTTLPGGEPPELRFSMPERSPRGGLMMQRDLIAALLLRIDDAQAARLLRILNPADRAERLQLLYIVGAARTKRAEPLLRKIEPVLELPESVRGRQCSESDECWRWIAALRATGTQWCRDWLATHEVWEALLALGDPRAADGGQFLFETGKVREAITNWLVVSGGRVGWRFEWSNTRRRFTRSREMVDRSVRELLEIWPSLLISERLAALSILDSYPESISNDLLRVMLLDAYAPIRLAALQYIWRYERPVTEESSPYIPWTMSKGQVRTQSDQ